MTPATLTFPRQLPLYAVAAALLTCGLGSREFWVDEMVTLGHIASLDATRDAFHPSGYYLLLLAWSRIFGASDFALRAFSVPCALGALWLLGATATRCATPRAAALAQWLLVLSPFAVLYFRMARYFALSALVAALLAYAALLVVQEGRRRHFAALAAAACLALLTDYLVAALLLPLFIYLAFRRRHLTRLAIAFIPILAIAALKAPVFLAGAASIHASAAGPPFSPTRILALIALPFYSLAVGETTDPWRWPVTLPAFAAAALLLCAGFRAARTRAPACRLLVAAWPFAIAAAALVMALVARAEPLSGAARSTLFAAPFACFTVALGAFSLHPRLRLCLLTVLFAANLYGLANYFTGRQFLNPGYAVPWRTIAAFITARQQPTDAVRTFYDSTIARYAAFPDYADLVPDQARAGGPSPEQLLAAGRRVWIVARDRGSALATRTQQDALTGLAARAAGAQTFRFMPTTPWERKARALVLRRPVADAYVTVTLFSPREPAP